jgi:hypothetical protein
MSTALQPKIDSTMARADEVLARRLRREEARLEAEEAIALHEAAEQARSDAWRCREIAGIYDDAFRAHGVETPPPRDDERPSAYRRRLFNRLVRKLPDRHDLAGVRADELPAGQAFVTFEAMLLQAAKQEGEKPSFDNLPRDGSMIARHRVDADTGQKITEYYGRRSFIGDLNRPARRVTAILNPKDNTVIWGRPLRQQPTFR